MATKAKPWPRNAEYIRLDCIVLAEKIVKLADELILEDQDPLSAMRMLVQGKDMAREIAEKLRSAK